MHRRRFLAMVGGGVGVGLAGLSASSFVGCGRRVVVPTAPPPRFLADVGKGIALVPVGTLVVPSGAIVAADPLVSIDYHEPFAETVAPGRYAVAVGQRDGDVACAVVRFSQRAVVSWVLATCPSDDRDRLERGDALGYAVDSGKGCFADAIVARAVRDINERGDGEQLYQRLRAAGLADGKWASVVIDDASGANLIAFSSGAGDGSYASWWGRDAEGQAVVLVTDFGLLDDRDDE